MKNRKCMSLFVHFLLFFEKERAVVSTHAAAIIHVAGKKFRESS